MACGAQAYAARKTARREITTGRFVWKGAYSSDDGQANVDIAAGGVGVGANMVGLLHQRFGVSLGNAGQRDREINVETETAFRARANADRRGYGRIRRNLHAAALGRNGLHRADEAGGIAGREKLLGIVAGAAATTQLLGGCELDAEGAVGGRGGAVAAAGGLCGGLVEDFYGHETLP